ncbi:hypothetical protein CIHG_07577 [Coccidioides immitis H538.4]|uniref:Uncharacterized protein n=2 Tax=Coccidioides immitis TaxID=5501 RepID=A0A0J8S0F3_COCIT|nr:hypothetical protein CIRG_07869 [Coccidioides immitis RMSCC 2394]KMU89894.1 hypothetical protein CIHG_07577 [Coccidioides immitis H538.4]
MNIRHSSKHADFGGLLLVPKDQEEHGFTSNARIFVATLKRMPQQMQGPQANSMCGMLQACLWRRCNCYPPLEGRLESSRKRSKGVKNVQSMQSCSRGLNLDKAKTQL